MTLVIGIQWFVAAIATILLLYIGADMIATQFKADKAELKRNRATLEAAKRLCR